MTSKRLGLVGCLTALAAVAIACGTPPPDSVTIPRSNTAAQNASSPSESLPDSDGLSAEGIAADDPGLEDIPAVGDLPISNELPELNESLDTAVPGADLSGDPAALESAESSVSSGISEVTAAEFFTADPNHPTSGSMKVFEIAGQAIVELADDFNTASGPNLQLVAYRDAVVPEQISSNDYVPIANLATYSGASAYPVPEEVDLDEFGAIAIWCAEFNTVFGYAPL